MKENMYSIISSKKDTEKNGPYEEHLNINYKDNVEIYLKNIENHLSFDFIKK